MNLTTADVLRLARQARFTLSPEELERFRAQLSSVLRQMQMLDELATFADGDAPPAGSGTRLRADDSEPDKLALPLASFSSDLTSDFFTVPRVIGDGGPPQ